MKAIEQTDDHSSLSDKITRICESADADGIAMSAFLNEEDVYLSELHRDPTAAPGLGRKYLDALVALAHAHAYPVHLCCTAWNSALVTYYERAGFMQIYEKDEEVYMEASPVER